MDSQSAKQRVSELLRNAESVVVATVQNPTIDHVAAAVALGGMLDKLGKKVSVVVSKMPRTLDWLPLGAVKKEPAASRDFIIELDTSQIEADKLKYTQEGKKLRIYITPFEGNFTHDHVSFDYGDYHNEAVVLVGGTSRNQLDPSVSKHKQLLAAGRFVTIHNEPAGGEERTIAWHEEASSVCEMLMSISESLGNNILDKDAATALLTGIIDSTDHFSKANTTPKVMTMSAQLMAAGADQGVIIEGLKLPPPEPQPAAPAATAVKKTAPPPQPQGPSAVKSAAKQAPSEGKVHDISPPRSEAAAKSTEPPKPEPSAEKPARITEEQLKDWKPFDTPEPETAPEKTPPATPNEPKTTSPAPDQSAGQGESPAAATANEEPSRPPAKEAEAPHKSPNIAVDPKTGRLEHIDDEASPAAAPTPAPAAPTPTPSEVSDHHRVVERPAAAEQPAQSPSATSPGGMNTAPHQPQSQPPSQTPPAAAPPGGGAQADVDAARAALEAALAESPAPEDALEQRFTNPPAPQSGNMPPSPPQSPQPPQPPQGPVNPNPN